MSDYTPVNSDQAAYTSTASGAIVGGTLVTANGNGTVATSVSGDHSVGVAAHDAPSGGRVTVYILAGEVHEVLITNTIVIAAGAPVIADAAGAVKTGTLATVAAAGTLLGICLIGGTGVAVAPFVKARFIGLG